MKKHLNLIIIIGVIVLLFGGVFLISLLGAPKYLQEITYEEYATLSNSNENNYFYYGDSEEEKDQLKAFAKEKGWVIYYFNLEKLSDKEKEDLTNGNYDGTTGLFKVTNDANLLYEYSGSFTGNDFKQGLLTSGIIKELISINVHDYLKLVKDKGARLIFIGSSTCSWCIKFKPEVTAVINKYNVEIYYLGIDEMSEEEYRLLEDNDDYIANENWGTPLSFLFKDGQKIDIISGYLPEADLVDFLKAHGVI